jgi:hypothetical protein
MQSVCRTEIRSPTSSVLYYEALVMRRPGVEFPSPAYYETQAQRGFQAFETALFCSSKDY